MKIVRQRVYDHAENCIEMARVSIKMHKRFLDIVKIPGDLFWLDDAEKYADEAAIALEYNMLPSELKNQWRF